MYGFFRVAAAVPVLRVADVRYNSERIWECFLRAEQQGVAVTVFPELGLTGYSCGDLFFQNRLRDAATEALLDLADRSAGHAGLLIVGLPLAVDDRLYNVAAVVGSGRIHGLVPKCLLPNYREFYEKRQFHSGRGTAGGYTSVGGVAVPFGMDLLFDTGQGLRFGVEICEDLWGVVPPSLGQCLAGARVVFNLSAGTELAGKSDYRRDLVKQQSARCLCAYVLAGAGVHESTTDAVFGGHALIADNGRLCAETARFSRQSELIPADIDIERLAAARMSESSFADNVIPGATPFRTIPVGEAPESPDLEFLHNPAYPFVPPAGADRRERCDEIFNIQCAGLARRMEHIGCKALVIGVSGGLDSTLALLVAAASCRLLDRPMSDIIAYTLPGFGTTGRTYDNAVKLCNLIGVTLREVDIRPACLQHFRDIGHDPEVRDTTYENVQARERTQILMDAANKCGGIVIGTGDLSEIALGWSTYNGDHMSMYAVNCSIPKTLIRYLIEATAERSESELAAVLRDVNATPVSPELLPPCPEGRIEQKTEEIIGPYDLHDYFLYHFLKYGAPPEKIRFMALHAFEGIYDAAVIDRTLEIFIRRFFQQQFKRSCMPDGPKVGTIALSPRADWRMPSDASDEVWR